MNNAPDSQFPAEDGWELPVGRRLPDALGREDREREVIVSTGSQVGSALQQAREALKSPESGKPTIEHQLVGAIVNDFKIAETKAIAEGRRLPASYTAGAEGYSCNRFLLFEDMMRESYPAVLADPKTSTELRLFLLKQCGIMR